MMMGLMYVLRTVEVIMNSRKEVMKVTSLAMPGTCEAAVLLKTSQECKKALTSQFSTQLLVPSISMVLDPRVGHGVGHRMGS